MKKVICDYCNKESDNMTEYVLPDYVTYEAKDLKGSIVCKFVSNNEIHSTTKDVCPNCAKKIIGLLQLVPRVNFEEENNIETMSIKW